MAHGPMMSAQLPRAPEERDQNPMLRSFDFGTPSRAASRSTAVRTSGVANRLHKTRTDGEGGSSTRVTRLPPEARANSTGRRGPSWNHSPRRGRVSGFQTSEPQPRHPTFISPVSHMCRANANVHLRASQIKAKEGSSLRIVRATVVGLSCGRDLYRLPSLGDQFAEALRTRSNLLLVP